MMTPAIAFAAMVCTARTVTLDQAERAAEAQAPAVREARADAAAGQARTEAGARARAAPGQAAKATYERATGNRRQRPGRTTQVSNSWTTYNWFEGQATAKQLVWDFGLTLNRWRAAEARAVALDDTERASLLEALGNGAHRVFPRARRQGADRRGQADARQPGAPPRRRSRASWRRASRPDIDLAQARAGTANARVAVIRAETGYGSRARSSTRRWARPATSTTTSPTRRCRRFPARPAPSAR